jgi:type IV secretion system protein VirD4
MPDKVIFKIRVGVSVVWALIALCLGIWAIGAVLLHKSGADWHQAGPLTAFQYWHYHWAYPATRRTTTAITLLDVAVIVGGLVVIWRAAAPALFGNRRLASLRDIRSAGLFGGRGLIVGKRAGRYVTFGGTQHVLLSAPTRSGKGVGVVIPNLLNWPDSVVVLDMKHENWELTAGFRAAHGQEVYLFDPTAKEAATHRYNPLDTISRDPKRRVTDVQKIANMIWPDGEGSDPFWYESARKLFLGLVLLCIETGKSVTLGEVFRQVTADDEASEHLTKEIAAAEKRGLKLSAACRNPLNDFVSAPANTRGSIRMSFTAKLELWANPLVDLATSRSDFSFADLRRKRMSVYLGVTPDAIAMMRPLVNLMFQQAADANIVDLPPDGRATTISSKRDHSLKYQLLLLLDEFANFGAMPTIANGITYFAGYNVRLLTVIQSPAQLQDTYGRERAQTMMENHALHIAFAPKDQHTAEDLSRAIGYRTVTNRSRSHGLGFQDRHRSENLSDAQRALFLPQELRDIGDDKAVITLDNARPFLVDKLRYYADSKFSGRLRPAPAVPVIDLIDELAARTKAADGRADDEVRRERARASQDEREAARAAGAKTGRQKKAANPAGAKRTAAKEPAIVKIMTATDIAGIDAMDHDQLFDTDDMPDLTGSGEDAKAFIGAYLGNAMTVSITETVV